MDKDKKGAGRMPLDSATQWKQQADDSMIEVLKSQPAPATVSECQVNEKWWAIFGLYAEANFADESVDFLNAVDDFKRAGDMGKAEAIYNEFVSTSAPRQVNLYSGNFEPLKEAFEGQDALLGSLDMFDAAYAEVQQMLGQHTYRAFCGVASSVRDELLAEDTSDSEATETAGEISAPELVDLTRDRVDDAVVDNFNQLALKELDEGFTTNFWQLDDLVIIATRSMATEDQPYVKWIREQPGVARACTVTMTAKGGAFSPGSITVKGASNRDAFKAAVARVSKKKIVFE